MFVYALHCDGDKYYIGKSSAPIRRVEEHFAGEGAHFTKVYPPIQVVENTRAVGPYAEDNLVKTYMKKHGIDNVRGGSYSQLEIPEAEVAVLRREIGTATDGCLRCGRLSHWVSDCFATSDVDGKALSKPLRPERRTYYRLIIPGEKQHGGCFRCGRFSHLAYKCFATTDVDGKMLPRRQ